MGIPWKKLSRKAWDLLVQVIRATAPDKTQCDPPPDKTVTDALDKWRGGGTGLLLILSLAAPVDAQTPTQAQVDSLRREVARLDSALGAVKAQLARLDSLLAVAPDTTPTPPDTTPTPVPTLPAWAQAVDRLLGPIPNCATLATGPAREWYDKWQLWEPKRWAADSARWDAANYYDRASIYYAMAVCELPHDPALSARYLDRAHQTAVDYRDKYLIKNDGGASPHWAQLEGVALHAVITGDAASRRIIGRTAEVLAASNYYRNRTFGDTLHVDMENRIAQRALLAALLAHDLQSPGKSFPATRWPGVLDTLLAQTLRAQRADGSWRYRCAGGCKLTFPYMDALLTDVLIRYQRLYRADARLLPVIKATVDYHLANAIRADSSWHYNLTPSTFGSKSASPDLNGLQPSTYAWLAAQTGDPSYLARVQPLFVKGVRATYYAGVKQFNQAFYSSYRYVAAVSRVP